ncbi:MAG: phosphoribosylglycinamide formyltransferase [Planctomycetota bacterium]
MARSLKVIALISGGGRTVLNLLDAIERGELAARIDLVIASRADAEGIGRCRERGIETTVVASRDFRKDGRPDWAAMSAALDRVILPRKPDLALFAGYLCLYRLPAALEGRAMNIHPALLPSFGGQGLWGEKVHEAVLASGVKVSGCTVHFVANEYDAGPIIVQRTCPVLDADTPETLAARVFREECLAYPEAVRLYGEGRLAIRGNRVFVRR